MARDVSQVNLVLVGVFDHLESRIAAFAQPARSLVERGASVPHIASTAPPVHFSR